MEDFDFNSPLSQGDAAGQTQWLATGGSWGHVGPAYAPQGPATNNPSDRDIATASLSPEQVQLGVELRKVRQQLHGLTDDAGKLIASREAILNVEREIYSFMTKAGIPDIKKADIKKAAITDKDIQGPQPGVSANIAGWAACEMFLRAARRQIGRASCRERV